MIVAFISLLIQIVFASSGGGHHEVGIPTVVFYQAINVALFVGILVWFGKDKVRAVFRDRLSEFHRLAQETEKARKDLEYKKADLVRRADQLHKTSQQSLQEAKQEAEKFYLEEIEKSKKQAQKIDKDAEAQIVADQQKLIEKLRIETLDMSVASAEQQMGALDTATKKQVSKNVQQRIEGASL